MPRIEVYGSNTCGYCHAARRLLDRKGVDYEVHSVDLSPATRRAARECSGRRTVPRICVDGRPLGGFDDIAALDMAGELDAVLGLEAGPAPTAGETG